MAIPISTLNEALPNWWKAVPIEELAAILEPQWPDRDDRYAFNCDAAITRVVEDMQTGEEYVVDIDLGWARAACWEPDDLLELSSAGVMALGAADALDCLCEWARSSDDSSTNWAEAWARAEAKEKASRRAGMTAPIEPFPTVAVQAGPTTCYYCGKTAGSDACKKAHD